MKELIKKWQHFMVAWKQKDKNWVKVYDEHDQLDTRLLKPSFSDFMDWLSEQIFLE